MKTNILLILLLSFASHLQAQNTGFYGTQNTKDICNEFAFQTPEEVFEIIDAILLEVGSKRNFEVMECKGVGTCKATSFKGMPIIIYDPQFLAQCQSFNFSKQALPKGSTTNNNKNWEAITILAHEIGHHVNQHISNQYIRDQKTPNELELEADEFAGFVLYRLGATLAQAQQAMYHPKVTEQGTYTHPARSRRLTAIKQGWERASCSEVIPVPPPKPSPSVKVDRPSPPPSPKPAPKPKDLIPENMVFVEGGTFMMGCERKRDGRCNNMSSSLTQTKVNNFYISKYEVTNEDFCKFLNLIGNQEEEGYKWLSINISNIKQENGLFVPLVGYEKHPVVGVTWFGANAYCKWKGGRLPTEEEWEYAARGGSKSRGYKYSGSNDRNQVSWSEENSGKKTHHVGLKDSNELGIFDMSGNVWEWCLYDKNSHYLRRLIRDRGLIFKERKYIYRVARGGSYMDLTVTCISGCLYDIKDSHHYPDIGFRLVLPANI